MADRGADDGGEAGKTGDGWASAGHAATAFWVRRNANNGSNGRPRMEK